MAPPVVDPAGYLKAHHATGRLPPVGNVPLQADPLVSETDSVQASRMCLTVSTREGRWSTR